MSSFIIILLIVLSPLILLGIISLYVIIDDIWLKSKPFDPIEYYGYNPDSPMVKRFQQLAGIPNGSYLRDRFNRMRCSTSNIR